MVHPHHPRARTRPIMTTTDHDVADHHAAGALADELPYWGWLPDERTCLTRRGELVTLARLTPTVVDGHTPDQLDATLNRWQRMLSGVDARTRIYFYLLRLAGDLSRRRYRLVGRRGPRPAEAARVPRIAHPTDRHLSRVVLRPEAVHGRSRQAQCPVVETLRADVDDAAAESQRSDLLPRADSTMQRRAFGNRSTPAVRSSRTSPRSTSSMPTTAPASSRSW